MYNFILQVLEEHLCAFFYIIHYYTELSEFMNTKWIQPLTKCDISIPGGYLYKSWQMVHFITSSTSGMQVFYVNFTLND